jgi:hypothetical protein
MVLLSTSFANIALTVALAAVKPAYEGTKHSSKMSLKIPRKSLTGSQDHLSWVQEAMKVETRISKSEVITYWDQLPRDFRAKIAREIRTFFDEKRKFRKAEVSLRISTNAVSTSSEPKPNILDWPELFDRYRDANTAILSHSKSIGR